MAKDTKRLLEIEAKKFRPVIRDAFLQAIRDIKRTADMQAIVTALESRDVAAVLAALRLGQEYWGALEEAIRTAYTGGGKYALDKLPKVNPATGKQLVVRFQGTHPRAETAIKRLGGNLIVEITTGQREMVREAVTNGLQAGRNPRVMALDLVGRVNKRTGRREGGLVGLTNQESGWVRNYRDKLTGEDRAIDQINRMVARYENKTLLRRGTRIARTETTSALNAGRDEGMAQLIDQGEVRAENVTGEWQTSGNKNVRDSHRDMDTQKRPFGVPFDSPTGAQMMAPADTSLGAGAEDVANCACYKAIKIDFLAGLRS